MAGTTNDEAGAGKSVEGNSSAQCYQSGEALAEWRSSEQVENALPSTSPPYWESDDDDEDDGGPKPSQLYGKHTWRIDKFSQTTKRELRSNAFEVGGYKWYFPSQWSIALHALYAFMTFLMQLITRLYILIYPQGCDVCNHLSLFLCVANHDKLLPGWSHFAQFTIAVVNKDPKKSKYSDTLHRFWKKEHDWGWKKFMELSKVSEGFLDAADTLIIKAQVQVIREKADRPFRCLDAVYRRELVRVYLTNVETICRRFMEDKRGKLGKLIEDKSRWTSFSAFWLGIDQNTQRRMSREKRDVILKVMVKHFFIEKEVTSTLVMDSLYSGLKALEGHANSKKARAKLLDSEESAAPVVCVEKDMFVLVDDVLLLLERVALEPLPPKDEKGPQNRTKEGNSTEDFNKDSVERDERRLTELGRRTVETFVLAHIFNHKIEVAYQEAVALKRQEELIREEEFEAWLAAGSAQKNKQGGNDKEKKSKKKQSKQKRNSRKGKDKVKDERSTVASLDKHQEENTCKVKKVQSIEELQPVVEKLDILEGVSDVSDNIEFVAEVPQPDSEDRDASPVNWDTDASEVHPPTEASSSGISGSSSVPNGGTERRNTSAMDDSSSTCSTDSILSIPVNGSYKGNSYSNFHHEKSSSRRKNQKVKMTSEGSRIPDRDGSDHNTANGPGRTVECDSEAAVRDRVSESHPIAVRKEEDNGSVEKNSSIKETFNVERSLKERPTSASSSSSPPRSPPKNIPSYLQLSSDNKSSPSVERDGIQLKKSSNDSQAADKLTYPVPSPQNSVMTKAETQQAVTSKPSEKTAPQVSPMSRPSSAPLTHGLRPATPVVSVVPTCPLLSRSISAAGRLGPDNLMANYVPQSYRNAIIGNSVGPSTSGFSHSASTSSSTTICPAHKQPSSLVSSSMFSPQNSGGIDPSGVCRGARDASHGGTLWVDGSPRDPARGMRCDSSSSMDGFQNHDLSHRVHTGFSDQFSRELPACPSGRQTQGVVTDEFPHLDIINDLLNDEHAVGMGADTGRFSHSFNNGPQVLSRQFSFPYDVGASGNVNSSAGSSCRFERTRSYHDMGFQGGYNSFSSHLETMRDFIPQANPRPFMNDQIEGMIPPNQWQLSGSNLSSMDMRTRETECLPYFTPEFPDVNPVNGYTIYRPSKRH